MPGLYRYRLLLLLTTSFLLVSAFSELRAQWVKLAAFNDGTFYNEVFFYDQNLGFVTSHDGSVLRTVNGGSTWSTVTLPNANFSANRDICFVSTSDGFISGEDGIWKTANGGTTWTNVTPAGASTIGSAASWFRNASVGIFAYGHCLDSVVTFWRTTDGGANWTSTTYTHTPDVGVGGITYTGGIFYAAGSSGKFWKSTDDGVTWTLSNTNSAGWQEDLIASPTGSLLIASADGTSCGATGGGKLLTSTNGGTNWTTTSYARTVTWGVSMYSGTDGWAVGDFGKAYKTTDGGLSWTENSCGLDPGDRLDDVWMIDATHGFVVGDGIYRFAVNEFVTRPDTINFGDVIIGRTRGDSAAIVRAIGTTGTVTARAIVGTDASQFVSPSGLGNPQVVPTCTDAATLIRFQPTTLGPKLARIEFTITGLSAPLVVYLKGRGVKPSIVGPKAHRMDTLVCKDELLDTIIYTNVGDYPLSIDSVVFANDVGNFSLVSPAIPVQIQPQRNAEFIVRGRAAGNGQMSGRMYFYTNDPDYQNPPWVTALTMYKKRIEITLPDTLVIPSRPPDSTSTLCLVLKNSGQAGMTSGRLTTTSGDPTISTTFTGPVTIQAGDSTTICFNGRAFDTLARCKSFRLIWEPCGIETEVVICYQAAEGAIDAPENIALQAGCGETERDTFYLYNRGNDVGRIGGAELVGSDKDAFALIEPKNWPSTIPVGDSLAIVLEFSPDGTKGTSRASLIFDIGDGSKDTVQVEGILRAPVMSLTEHFNDIGKICPGDERALTVILSNTGNDETAITAITPIDSEERIEVQSRPGGPLLGNETDSVLFTIRGTRSGPISARFIVTYDSPCLDPDTVTISGVVLDSSLTIDPVPIDFKVVPVGKSGIARTIVRNTSDTTVTVTVGDPMVPGVTVTHPTTDIPLAPGDTLEITLRFSPDAETTLNGILPVNASGRCDEEYAIPIKGNAPDEAVYLSGDIDLGILLCDETREDTIFIYNQSSGDVRVAGVQLSDDRGYSYTLPQTLPITIPANDSIPVVITAKVGIYGPFTTQITVSFDQGPVTELTATIRAERQATETRFVEQDGSLLTTFQLPPLSRCRSLFDTVLIMQNFGNIADTLDVLAAPSPVITFTSPLPVVLLPGEKKEVPIRVELTAVGRIPATVQASSRVCGTTTEAATIVEYVAIEIVQDAGISFGDVCIGRDSTVDWVLRNQSGHPINVARVEIEGTGFSLISTDPFTIGPESNHVLPIIFAPVAEELSNGLVRVITDAPCADTIVLVLLGAGTKCSIPELVIRVDDVRGRWGTVQPVPVIVSGFNIASVQELTLSLTASPRMLHPGSVRFADWAAGKWSVADQVYDPVEGVLTITLNQASVNAPSPGSDIPLENALFFEIDCTVLRGDSISTLLNLELLSLSPEGTVETEDGRFLLEDYCDAYGRLLQASGNLALRPSVPNPATERATIEYELPFSGHTTLSVFDLTGNEVLRLLDDVVPAGRRQTTVDVSTLPSGAYTVRLNIGLQTLTQRILVAK